MEDLFNFLLALGLSERQVLVLVFWVAEGWLWLIGGNVLIAGAIKYIRTRYGDCVISWSLLIVLLLNSVILALIFFVPKNICLFLAWLLVTSLTLNHALGRRSKA